MKLASSRQNKHFGYDIDKVMSQTSFLNFAFLPSTEAASCSKKQKNYVVETKRCATSCSRTKKCPATGDTSENYR